jgi:hypothetical protein
MAREQRLRRQLTGLPLFVRMVLAVGVFGLAGPPIGGLATWATMGTMMRARSLRSPLPFITGAYAEGLELALYTGLVCAVVALLSRSVGWLVPVISALVVSFGWTMVVALSNAAQHDLFSAIARTSIVFVPASIVAAIVCWPLARPLLRRRNG